MGKRKINWLMVLFSTIGGVTGFIIGEIILRQYIDEIPNSLLMGVYFGILAFCIGMMCLLAEIIAPVLNGLNWKYQYAKSSWKYIIVATFIFLLIGAAVVQFIYGINITGGKRLNDVVMLIDLSGSMKETDPGENRFKAAEELLGAMDETNRVSLFVFNDQVDRVISMSKVDSSIREELHDKLENLRVPEGGTNIKGTLEEASKHIDETQVQDRAAMVILLSDGGDTHQLKDAFDETINPYKIKEIPVYTIGMLKSDYSLLKKISKETGGNYYNVKDAKELKGLFNKIYRLRESRLLVDRRYGMMEHSLFYAILRILCITVLGVLIGWAVALTFDNKYIARSFTVGGIISGLAAGVILEFGFGFVPWAGGICRFTADLVLAFLVTLFPVWVPGEESLEMQRKGRRGSREEPQEIHPRSRLRNNRNDF